MPHVDLCKNQRYVEIFRELVETYVETGEPVGSRFLSKRMANPLSPATIRNVMADLEDLGILCSDHSSSGRKPTEKGWRFFVNGLIETSDISEIERQALMTITSGAVGQSVESTLEKATDILSGLSNCVSLIVAPTINAAVKHIDFVLLSPGKAIVIIVTEDGIVENRLIEVPHDISSSVFEQATSYINAKLSGMNLYEIRSHIQNEVTAQKEGVDTIVRDIVEKGIGFIANDEYSERVIVRGQSNLISKDSQMQDLKDLFKRLDEKQTIKTILDKSINGQGIQVFIGSESKMFEMSGCSMIVAPYQNSKKKLVGAIGVLGPSRMRYSRVITLVDYTAKLLGKLM